MMQLYQLLVTAMEVIVPIYETYDINLSAATGTNLTE